MSETQRRSNRGFWLVIAPIAAIGIVLIVLIVIFRPRSDPRAASVTQQNLRTALAAATAIRGDQGTLAAASALPLREAEPDLLFIDPDEASNAPEVISVLATDASWTGAARATDGTCYWIRTDASGATVTGTGSTCSGQDASTAAGGGWASP